MAERVLIINDDEKVRNILQVHLDKAGYHISEAKDAERAYKILEENSFEVVICDIRKIGGKILEHIKERYGTLPVIMLTGSADVDTAIELMKKGAVDYLTKPIKKDELLIALEIAVEQKRLLEGKRELENKNREYQHGLEQRIIERTSKLEEAYSQLKRATFDMVKALSGAIEAKDPFTQGHSYRVSQLSVEIAKRLDFSEEQLEILEYGSLLHDIGKIGIKEEILKKPARLTIKEYTHIKRHSIIGEEIIRPVEIFRSVLPLIRNHHEHFDGRGYPDGLKGKEINIFARIIAIPDSFDAMTSDRPYRKALIVEDALLEVKRVSQTQFDPQIVDIFIGDKVYDRYIL